MPVTKSWRDLGIDLPEPEGLSRLTGQDAFQTLSRSDQLQVMGPSRLQALDNGTPWSSLSYEKSNADWRTSVQITPVRDLVATSH